MGIGGDDYSHRSGQRSSLRELGEVERGQRRSGVGHGLCVAQASGGWAIRVGSALQRTVDGANPRALNSTTSPLSNLGASQDRKATATDAGKQAAGKHSRRSRPCPAPDGNRQPVLERVGKIIPRLLPPPVRQLQGTLSSRKLTLLSFN
jgi:hypothetical protein